MKALYPITVTSKLQECKNFYADVFGFVVVFEADWYIQIRHEQSGIELAFMSPGLDNQPTQLRSEFNGSGIIFSLEVDDATSEYEKIQNTSADIYYPLAKEEWGQTHFMIKDPSGVSVDVVQQDNQ